MPSTLNYAFPVVIELNGAGNPEAPQAEKGQLALMVDQNRYRAALVRTLMNWCGFKNVNSPLQEFGGGYF